MRRTVTRILCWVVVTGSFFSVCVEGADQTTIIYPQQSRGVWEGWGTSLCWWAQEFGARDDLADILFTTNHTVLNGTSLPGLGMNIARYNVGACSWNSIGDATMQESPNIFATRQMQGYWINWSSSDPESPSWNWSVDANQRSMLQKARDRGADQLELFSNSPMWWMCYNHNPSGANNGNNDNLQSWNYNQHAVYLATVAKYAQDHWGITFDSVDPFNEPTATWWDSDGTQEGCHFDVATQEAVIGHLRSELNTRGLHSTIISASDESHYDQARDTWNAFGSATKENVGRVNVHGYQYGGGRRDQLYNVVSASGTPLWNSEYGDSDGSGLSLARNLNLDFRWLRPTAWCYWQPLDWADWGLIDANLEDHWIGQPERKYYVLAQYTRHIRPGMTILTSDDGNTVAAYNPAARTLTLVTLNDDAEKTVAYDLSGFFNATGPVRRWVTETGSSVSYAPFDDIVISNQQFQATFPTETIQTFEIRNVDIHEPPQLAIETHGTNEQVLISWPETASDYQLYSTAELSDPILWQVVTNTPVSSNGMFQIMWSVTNDNHHAFHLSIP